MKLLVHSLTALAQTQDYGHQPLRLDWGRATANGLSSSQWGQLIVAIGVGRRRCATADVVMGIRSAVGGCV